MRIAVQGQSVELGNPSGTIMTNTAQLSTESVVATNSVESPIELQEFEEQMTPKEKLQQAIDSVNEFLNHSDSKFVFHEGLDQYFVQIVNTKTNEVVKEIPPKKLLDAFYEMQKLFGMTIDKKI